MGLLVFLFFLLTGCATYTSVLQHPESGKIEKCESKGAGLIWVALASSQHDDCVEQLEGLGYKPVPGSDAAED